MGNLLATNLYIIPPEIDKAVATQRETQERRKMQSKLDKKAQLELLKKVTEQVVARRQKQEQA